MENTNHHVQVIERAFVLLEELAKAEGSVGVGELARRTAMSKSTTHRILVTLRDLGYAEKNMDGEYTIGAKMFELVSYHINTLELQTESKPYLTALRQELNLTAHLGVLDGPYVVYVEKISLYPGTRLYTQVGYRSPAYCSSMGKCLLACLSGDELEDVLDQCEFEQFTVHTYTKPREFKKYLHQVRKQGWAMDNEEYKLGHRCIGAPIFDYRGDAVAAISASGTTADISDEKLDTIIAHVKETAREISARMGYIEGPV